MLHIILWKWRQENFRCTYTVEHVNKVGAMIRQHMATFKQPWRLVCVTDDAVGIDEWIDTYPLWKDYGNMPNMSGKHLPSCYRRLRIFDPNTQTDMGIHQGDRICSLDLDMIACGPLDEVLGKKDRFVGWACRGYYHPRVFNGSLWIFSARDLEYMWTEFDPKRTPEICLKAGFMGSDQAWLSYKLAKERWTFGWQWPQVASYPREVRRMRVLDRRTRIIFFHGASKPWQDAVQKECCWLHRYWKPEPPPAMVSPVPRSA